MTEPALSAYGLSIPVPFGWDARVARRPPSHPNEQTFPVVHLASFALPDKRDDFGGNVTVAMRSSDLFLVLFEYGPDAARQPMFRARGVPLLRQPQFSSRWLQRWRPGQLGCQRFFTANNRAFCLYAVAGSHTALTRRLESANVALGRLIVRESPR